MSRLAIALLLLLLGGLIGFLVRGGGEAPARRAPAPREEGEPARAEPRRGPRHGEELAKEPARGHRAVRVVDAGGRPVEGADVIGGLQTVVGETDADGRYAWREVDEVVQVRARRADACSPPVRLTRNRPTGLLVLGGGGVLEGVVRDGSGAPVERVRVQLFAVRGLSELASAWFGVTDSTGAYRIEGIPTDVRWLPLLTEWFGTALDGVHAADGSHAALPGDLVSDARVLRWEEPGVTQCDFRLHARERAVHYALPSPHEYAKSGGAVYWSSLGDRLRRDVDAEPGGRFAILVEDASVPIAFEAGDRVAVDFEPARGGESAADPERLRFSRAPRLLVRVRSGDTVLAPQDWSLVAYVRHRSSRWLVAHSLAQWGEWMSDGESASERFVIDLPVPLAVLQLPEIDVGFVLFPTFSSLLQSFLQGREARLDVVRPGARVAALARSGDVLDVEIPLPRSIVLRVVDGDGRPVPGVQVVLMDGDRAKVGEAVSGAHGMVRFDGLGPKAVAASARARPPYEGYWTAMVPLREMREPEEIVVSRLRTVTVRFLVGGERVPGSSVEVIGSFDHETHDDGSVTLTVAGDENELSFLVDGRRVEIPLPRDGETVTVRLERLARVRLVVVGTDEPVRIHAVDPETDELSAVTVEDGHALLEPTPQVLLAADPSGRRGTASWDGGAREVRIRMAEVPRHVLKLLFLDESGAPLPGLPVRVGLFEPGASRELVRRTDAEGAVRARLPQGPVVITEIVSRRDSVGLLPLERPRISLTKTTTVTVRTHWYQLVRLDLPDPLVEFELLDGVRWRRAGGAWRDDVEVRLPWEATQIDDAEIRLKLGTEPARIELRVGRETFAFDYPGRPIDPPLFRPAVK